MNGRRRRSRWVRAKARLTEAKGTPVSKKNTASIDKPTYGQGVAAAELGRPSTDCPYADDGEIRKSWLLGHRDKTAELAAASDD